MKSKEKNDKKVRRKEEGGKGRESEKEKSFEYKKILFILRT